jgi:hypothetical protein
MMGYRPSEARYAGGGQIKYLVYRSPQPLRTGPFRSARACAGCTSLPVPRRLV